MFTEVTAYRNILLPVFLTGNSVKSKPIILSSLSTAIILPVINKLKISYLYPAGLLDRLNKKASIH